MNFGILMVQGLVNSFGPVIMAAFAAAVKIDSFAYMPVQDFGNAFSTFVSQIYGAGKHERIREGIKKAAVTSVLFCVLISALVLLSAKQLMLIFVQPLSLIHISILLGMSMGAGALFAIYQGQGSRERLRAGIVQAFGLISLLTVILYIAVYLWLDPIMIFLRVPDEVYALMREYLWIIFIGLAAVFLYNFFACLLRALGNSVTPLVFLAVSALLNIALDLLFVLRFSCGVGGAAAALSLIHIFGIPHCHEVNHAST